jgi:hypothetical protein
MSAANAVVPLPRRRFGPVGARQHANSPSSTVVLKVSRETTGARQNVYTSSPELGDAGFGNLLKHLIVTPLTWSHFAQLIRLQNALTGPFSRPGRIACRRARGHQDQAFGGPLSGAGLDRRCARRRSERAAGTGKWAPPGPNKEITTRTKTPLRRPCRRRSSRALRPSRCALPYTNLRTRRVRYL